MTMLARACARNAVSRWSLAGTALILLLGALPPLPELPGFTLGQRLAAVVAALVPSLGLLALARVTWLSPGSRWATPTSALLTFAGAGALAGATRGWAATALAVDLPVDAAWRVPSTAVAAALWLSLMAVAVDFMRTHRQIIRTLRAEEVTLAATEHDVQRQIAERRALLLAPVHGVIDRVSRALGAGGRGTQEADDIRLIREEVEAHVRPMSHDMLTGDVAVDAPTPPAHPAPRWVARLARAAARRVTHHPGWVALLPVVLFPLVMGPRWGVAFMLTNAGASWVMLAAGLAILRRVLEPLLIGMSTTQAALGLTLGYTAVTATSITATTGIELALLAQGVSGAGGLAFAGIVILVIFIAASVIEATAGLLHADERDLRATITQVEWSLARLRQQLRFDQQRIGRQLHGDVQGTLLGIAREIEAIPPDAPPGERQTRARGAAERLRAASTLLTAPPPDDQSLEDALDGVLLLSRRALDVDVDVASEASQMINATPSARRVVVDVISESITNALRHGNAHAVRVTVTRAAATAAVRIAVTDDGTWTAPGPGGGAGSALYDEVSPAWSLGPGPEGGTRLDIVIPCGIRPGTPATTPRPSRSPYPARSSARTAG